MTSPTLSSHLQSQRVHYSLVAIFLILSRLWLAGKLVVVVVLALLDVVVVVVVESLRTSVCLACELMPRLANVNWVCR